MRLLILLVLSLVALLPLAVRSVAQGAPPQQPVPQPPAQCYQLRFAEVPGVNFRWARLQTGDEWITGCLGPAGACFAPVWIKC